MLATVWILVSGATNRELKVRALLDQGATGTFITAELVKALQIQTYPVNAQLERIGDDAEGCVSRVVPITIAPTHGRGPIFSADAFIQKSPSKYQQRSQLQ